MTRRSFGAGLVDEHHAAVEIALLAGQPLIDLVGDDVGDAAPVFRRGEILLAGELLAGDDVPQAEFRLEPPVALPRHAAGHQRLRVDGLPVLELRRDVDVGDALDIGGLVDRREQSAALQIVGDDLGDADADFAVGRRARHEIRDRDRQRRERRLRSIVHARLRRARSAPAAPGRATPSAAIPEISAGGSKRQTASSGRSIVDSWTLFGLLLSRIAATAHQVSFGRRPALKYFHSSKYCRAAG